VNKHQSPQYIIGQTVTIPGCAHKQDGHIEAINEQGEYLINGTWYSGESIWKTAQAITEAYYQRNPWARPATLTGRSFITGHFRGGSRR